MPVLRFIRFGPKARYFIFLSRHNTYNPLRLNVNICLKIVRLILAFKNVRPNTLTSCFPSLSGINVWLIIFTVDNKNNKLDNKITIALCLYSIRSRLTTINTAIIYKQPLIGLYALYG